jgi:acyl-homoserine lactone acylase PvdQ
MTTGGPDTSDVYEEEVQDGKYKFRDAWRPLETRREKIGVKVGDKIDWKEVTIESTAHGPIVAHKDGKSYSVAIPYADEVRLMDESWEMVTAHNLAEMKKALAMLQFMAQNIMVGTVDGDIYYVRNGRVPVRPKGCDPSKPLPGASGACEWQGIHPFEDLVQITNPPQGYMQNCNVSPFAMMKDSPLVPEEYAEHPYIYNERRTPPHQRAAMMLDLLDAARNVTAEQAIRIALSPQVWRAELWQDRIQKAAPESAIAKTLAAWDRRSDADSRGALAFYLFKMSLEPGPRHAVDPPADLTGDQIQAALANAEKRLASEFPPDAVFGSLFRVGRQGAGRTWPVGGGSLTEAGMATPRAVSFEKSGNRMLGHGGQTSTQIVILTKPPQSYMVIPLGESDHPDSPHFDDQAEKLFSKSRVKSTYFLDRKELEKHVTAREELEFLR